ncbi:MAG: 3-hydroxyacyl-CoA dehydrogenase NAD-binding domain-containing protein [Myxococcales bacterium]
MATNRIRKVGVLGAGVMGSGIAAHVAGAGVPVVLLDIVPPDLKPEEKNDRAARNRFANGGKERALAARPAAFFTQKDAALIQTGNLEDDLSLLASCDWIVEAVKEDASVKQALFAKIEQVAPNAIVTSNTSGIPLATLTHGRTETFSRNFLITHFFNPVRYMKLLELVVGPKTDPQVVELLHRFGEDQLGKGIVYAKDTPNFVANRIGTFAVMDTIRQMMEYGLSIDEVDAIHGKPLGHPKSAVFRTADIVGLDTLLHVANNCYTLLKDDEEREIFNPPDFMKEMVKRGMLGDKTKGGFYKKTKEGILSLDWKTLEYKPQQKARFESTGEARNIENAGERIKHMVNATDKAGEFAWNTVSRALNYSALRLGEIADDVVNVDRAMRWGFNWDLGPFETLDAIGVKAFAEKFKASGKKLAPVIDAVASGPGAFYPKPGSYWDVRTRGEQVVPVNPRVLALPRHDQTKILKRNDSATLWDIGDGVLCVEFHSKMNSVDADNIQVLNDALDEAEKNFLGVVIGNEAPDAFSAGANIFMMLLAAREQQWDQIEGMVKAFQDVNQRLRQSWVPVVAAPFGLTLGGGAEIALAADAIRAHAELYMGLVEVGVGLIPGGGGCKEMVFRNLAHVPDNMDVFAPTQKTFETVGMARVSFSAEMAREMNFLNERDGVTLAREQLLRDAKETVLGLARAGYRPPRPRTVRVAGESGYATLKVGLWSMEQGHAISEHDRLIGTRLAKVLCGGNVAAGTRVTEQHLLDLEREAFLSLIGEEKTQARMEYMLTNNKPLRN